MIEENQKREYERISYYRDYYEKGYIKENEFKKVENQIFQNPDVCPKLIAKKPLSKKTNIIAIIVGGILWGIISALLKLAGISLGGIPTAIIIWLCFHFGKSIFQDTVEIQYHENLQIDDSTTAILADKSKNCHTEEQQNAKINEDINKCEICGRKTNDNENHDNLTEPKSMLCRKCGATLIDGSSFCNKCGTKVEKLSSIIKRKNPLIAVISIFLSLSIVSNIALAVFYNVKIKDYNELNSEYQSLRWDNSLLKGNYDSLKDDYDECESLREDAESYENEAFFFDNYAVIVYEGDKGHYHKYGCSHCDSSDSFWIYNTEAAESYGIKPCSYCF